MNIYDGLLGNSLLLAKFKNCLFSVKKHWERNKVLIVLMLMDICCKIYLQLLALDVAPLGW